ncbi:MAG: regulatory protein RecX [Myxococcota bacterium]
MSEAWDRLLRILTARSHGRAELRQKLRLKGHEAEEIEACLEKAERLQLLEDEASLAARFAAELRRKRGMSPLLARSKLMKRGFEGDVSDRAIRKAFADWEARTEALALLESEHDLQRGGRRLTRKGFPTEDVRWALQQLAHQEDDT